MKPRRSPRIARPSRRDLGLRNEAKDVFFADGEHARITLNAIADGVISTDVSGDITFLNAVAEQMTGWQLREVAGRPITEVLHCVDATTREAVPDPVELALMENRITRLPPNSVLIRRDGSELSIEDSVSPIHDRKKRVIGTVSVFRDASATRALAMRTIRLAEQDFLTGLANRALLKDRIDQAIALARRHKRLIAVLFLDLDRFKYINDSLGHRVGDKLLQSVARRLVECVRESDTVSRQGGDEFVVLLSALAEAKSAVVTARRMLQVVAQPHSVDQHQLHVTASIGVSVYPNDGMDAETLIQNADTAMYQAKDSGCHSYQCFTPAMSVRAVARQSIEEGLRNAFERKEFALHYQPIVNLRTGAIAGAEALLRWTHPTRGAVPPIEFIPVAEDCGLILPIGAWVLREACAQLRAWREAGLRATSMAVNVSAMQFRSESFLASLFAILEETGMDPSSLELELTESVLMKHADSTASILHTLRDRGVRLVLDDFGTGYSSLSYLKRFPVDGLKIDQSFVRHIGAAGEDTTIVTAVIAMARSLKLRVIAEGVETPEGLAFLRTQQCDAAQGYYFSRPVLPKPYAALLRTGIPGARGRRRGSAASAGYEGS